MNLLNAKDELNENYFLMNQVPINDYSTLPPDIVYEIFESQQIHSISYINKLSKFMNVDDLLTYKVEDKTDLNSEDVIWYFKNLITDVKYFTFGNEKKCKNISVLHRFLKEHHIGDILMHSYRHSWVVPFPEIKFIAQIPKEVLEEQKKNMHKKWFEFPSKYSDFFYILQESSHL